MLDPRQRAMPACPTGSACCCSFSVAIACGSGTAAVSLHIDEVLYQMIHGSLMNSIEGALHIVACCKEGNPRRNGFKAISSQTVRESIVSCALCAWAVVTANNVGEGYYCVEVRLAWKAIVTTPVASPPGLLCCRLLYAGVICAN
jgi:hypothetical protein